jgi:predicted glycoside hydrolase/deacetylase ChbG (UPF0249 family)
MSGNTKYHQATARAELDYAPGPRYAVVNADDFGLSSGINDGILYAHSHGIVTSASLMVRWPAAPEAATRARDYPRLSLGLHLDLGEWICQDGNWTALYEVVATESAEQVSHEVERQLVRFRELVGREPTHLDSHQHVHTGEPVRAILIEAATRLDVPLRHFHPNVTYHGDFYGQTSAGEPMSDAISVPSLVRVLESIRDGVSEIGCHPGWDDTLPTMYARERREEVAALCDPRVQAAARKLGIQFISFADLVALPNVPSPDDNRALVGNGAAKD